MGSLDLKTVNLVPGQLNMSQEVNMPIFLVTDWSLQNDTFNGKKKGISMAIVLKRKITSEMMTTYFPSLLLIAITFATTFFKPFFFEAALSVNLTTMLVMTTIFISKMEGLPPTSDIKMIDIWLIFCQIYPFFEVVLLTAMEYNRQDQEKDTENMEAFLVREVPSNADEKLEMDNSKKFQFCTKVVFKKYLPRLKTLGLLASHLHRDI